MSNIFMNEDDLVQNIKLSCYNIVEQWVRAGRKENLNEWMEAKYIPMLQAMLPFIQQSVNDTLDINELKEVMNT